VDLDIAEREIALTYVLDILSDQGLLSQLAFEGGTALRKMYLGATGRFSLDLDFAATGDTSADNVVLDLVLALHSQTFHGITFTIPSADYCATDESCGAEVTYHHDWVSGGRFGVQISFRAPPLLPVRPMDLRRERYVDWPGMVPPAVPTLDLHEVIAEKVRATVQRGRVRDLYDLYQLSRQPYDRPLVRCMAVVKCWETRCGFAPAAFLASLPTGKHDWSDLSRLILRDRFVAPADLVADLQHSYRFLGDLTAEEA